MGRLGRRAWALAACAALAAGSLASGSLAAATPAGGTAGTAASAGLLTSLEPELLSVAEPLDPAAPLVDRDAVAALAAEHLSLERVGPVSVSVRDLTSEDEVFSTNPAGALAPASTLKILTATAALSVLGPDTALTTSAVLTRTGPTAGTVTLVAGGDVALAPDLGQPAEVMGHAGLGDLAWMAAVELRRRGVETVQVRLDDTVFSGPEVYPDWEWTLGTTWGAPTAPLAVMGGRAGGAFDATTFVADPALVAVEQFGRMLSRYGGDSTLALPSLAVTGSVARAAAPVGAERVAFVDSSPIRELVAHMLRQSDNTMADALGRMTSVASGGPGSFAGCATAVKATLDDLGVPTVGLRMDDCSGLSHGSAVSAATLTSALVLAGGTDAGELGTVLRSLPVGALQGTLVHRFAETAAAGNLRAKTGTLTGVTSLAGMVQTTGGRELVFAVIANPDPKVLWTDSARQSIDRFAAALATL